MGLLTVAILGGMIFDNSAILHAQSTDTDRTQDTQDPPGTPRDISRDISPRVKNLPPEITPPRALVMEEDTPETFTILGISNGDTGTHFASSPVTIKAAIGNTPTTGILSSVSPEVATLDFDASTNRLVITPADNQYGEQVVLISISDGANVGAESEGIPLVVADGVSWRVYTLSVTVRPTNDPPIITLDSSVTAGSTYVFDGDKQPLTLLTIGSPGPEEPPTGTYSVSVTVIGLSFPPNTMHGEYAATDATIYGDTDGNGDSTIDLEDLITIRLLTDNCHAQSDCANNQGVYTPIVSATAGETVSILAFSDDPDVFFDAATLTLLITDSQGETITPETRTVVVALTDENAEPSAILEGVAADISGLDTAFLNFLNEPVVAESGETLQVAPSDAIKLGTDGTVTLVEDVGVIVTVSGVNAGAREWGQSVTVLATNSVGVSISGGTSMTVGTPANGGADDTVVFTVQPDEDFYGTGALEFIVYDLSGAVSTKVVGGTTVTLQPQSATISVPISILPVNDAPEFAHTGETSGGVTYVFAEDIYPAGTRLCLDTPSTDTAFSCGSDGNNKLADISPGPIPSAEGLPETEDITVRVIGYSGDLLDGVYLYTDDIALTDQDNEFASGTVITLSNYVAVGPSLNAGVTRDVTNTLQTRPLYFSPKVKQDAFGVGQFTVEISDSSDTAGYAFFSSTAAYTNVVGDTITLNGSDRAFSVTAVYTVVVYPTDDAASITGLHADDIVRILPDRMSPLDISTPVAIGDADIAGRPADDPERTNIRDGARLLATVSNPDSDITRYTGFSFLLNADGSQVFSPKVPGAVPIFEAREGASTPVVFEYPPLQEFPTLNILVGLDRSTRLDTSKITFTATTDASADDADGEISGTAEVKTLTTTVTDEPTITRDTVTVYLKRSRNSPIISVAQYEPSAASLEVTLANGLTVGDVEILLRALRYSDTLLKDQQSTRRVLITYDDGGDTDYDRSLATFTPYASPTDEVLWIGGRPPVASLQATATASVLPVDVAPPELAEVRDSFTVSLPDGENIGSIHVSWSTPSSDTIISGYPASAEWIAYHLYASKAPLIDADGEETEVFADYRHRALDRFNPGDSTVTVRDNSDVLSGFFWGRRVWLRPELEAFPPRAEAAEAPEPESAFDGFSVPVKTFTLGRDELYLAPGGTYTLHLEACDSGGNCQAYEQQTITMPIPATAASDGEEVPEISPVLDEELARVITGYTRGTPTSLVSQEYCGGAPNDDSDGDGVPNRIELQLGTDCRRALPDDFVGNTRPVVAIASEANYIGGAGIDTPLNPQVECAQCATLMPYYLSVNTAAAIRMEEAFGTATVADSYCDAINNLYSPNVLAGDSGCALLADSSRANGDENTVFLPTGETKLIWLGIDEYGNWALENPIATVPSSAGDADPVRLPEQSFYVAPVLMMGPDRLIPHDRSVTLTFSVAIDGETCPDSSNDETIPVSVRSPLPEIAEVNWEKQTVTLQRNSEGLWCASSDHFIAIVRLGGEVGSDTSDISGGRVATNTILFEMPNTIYQNPASPVTDHNGGLFLSKGKATLRVSGTRDVLSPQTDINIDKDGNEHIGIYAGDRNYPSYKIQVTVTDDDGGIVSLSVTRLTDGIATFTAARVGVKTVSVNYTVDGEFNTELTEGGSSTPVSGRFSLPSTGIVVFGDAIDTASASPFINGTVSVDGSDDGARIDIGKALRDITPDDNLRYTRSVTLTLDLPDLPDGYTITNIYGSVTVASRELRQVASDTGERAYELSLYENTYSDAFAFPAISVYDQSNDEGSDEIEVFNSRALQDRDGDGVPGIIQRDGDTEIWAGAGRKAIRTLPDSKLELGNIARQSVIAAIESMPEDLLSSIISLPEGRYIYDFVNILPSNEGRSRVVVPLVNAPLDEEGRAYVFSRILAGNIAFIQRDDDATYWAPRSPVTRECPAPAPVAELDDGRASPWRIGEGRIGDGCLLIVQRDGGPNDESANSVIETLNGENADVVGNNARVALIGGDTSGARRNTGNLVVASGGGGGGSVGVWSMSALLLVLLFASFGGVGRIVPVASAIARGRSGWSGRSGNPGNQSIQSKYEVSKFTHHANHATNHATRAKKSKNA